MSLPHCNSRLVLLLAFLLILTVAHSHSNSPPSEVSAQTSPPSAKAAHPAERHIRVGVAALVLPNVRWNKQQALAT